MYAAPLTALYYEKIAIKALSQSASISNSLEQVHALVPAPTRCAGYTLLADASLMAVIPRNEIATYRRFKTTVHLTV